MEGKNDRRYSIKFKRAGIKSSRTTKYYGVLTGIPMLQKFVPAKQFMANIDCPSCRGRKFSPAHDEHKLCHLSIGEFMCSTFWSLEEWIQSISSHTSESSLNFAVNQISMFVRNAVELDLGHLSFHRSIPTLSGGELQRLRLVQVFNTQLSDLLIILDEPLSGLSGEDKKAIFDNIVKLSEHHTMLIVDHNKTFIKKARTVTALGEKGGRHGGNIVDASKFIASQHLDQKYETPKPTEVNRIFLNAPIYGFSGAELEIGKCALNIIYGKSGVGKSTLLREYLPQYFTNYQYVQQKALVGKKDSSVATALNILDVIVGEFAKENGKDKKFFSKMSGGEGACRACSGKGFIGYGNDYRLRALIECRDCRGTGYSHKLNRYCIRGRNLRDVLSMTIEEGVEFFHPNKKIAEMLERATEILLGHLLIGQPTSTTLSGGENIRVKILRSLSSTSEVYGIDEPFKGLCITEMFTVVQFLRKLVKKKTVIVVDHIEESFPYFSLVVQLINDNGKLIGLTHS